MMIEGQSSVRNPQDHTNQWTTIQKLQGNALIPQYGAKYAKNGSECLAQIGNGIANTGEISVCNQEYSNESGIHPLAKTAKIAVDGQDCGTTQICVQKVVNTNTWSQTCRTDVPLSMRTCTTKTDYTLNDITSARTKPTEVCEEKRTSLTHSCSTSVDPSQVKPIPRCDANTWVNKNIANAEFGAPGWDRTLARYYCDLTMVDSAKLKVQVYAHGADGACIGWQTIAMDFSSLNKIEAAASLAPHWNGYCNYDVRVDATVTKTCTQSDPECHASLYFYHLINQESAPTQVTTLDAFFQETTTYTCPAGSTLGVSSTDYSTQVCITPTKSGVSTVNMVFLRPGYDIAYPAPVNSCSTYEGASSN